MQKAAGRRLSIQTLIDDLSGQPNTDAGRFCGGSSSMGDRDNIRIVEQRNSPADSSPERSKRQRLRHQRLRLFAANLEYLDAHLVAHRDRRFSAAIEIL
jgi:hypothetical protein